MKEVKQLVFQVAKWTIALNACAIILSAILIKNSIPVVLGIVFGVLFALLEFYALSLSLEKAVKKSPSQAATSVALGAYGRLALTAVVLMVAIKAPYLNELGTAFGIVSIKFVIYIMNFFNKKTPELPDGDGV